jgi:PAS domain S-box-containing protein
MTKSQGASEINADSYKTPIADDSHATCDPILDGHRPVSCLHRLQLAAELSSDAIVLTRLGPRKSPENPIIIYVNPAFEKMTGYSSDEVVGQTARILYGPKTDPQALRRMTGLLQNFQPAREEIVNYRKDGTQFTVDVSVVPLIDEHGEFTHFIAVERDTTEQVRLRERFLLAEQIAGMGTYDVMLPSGQIIWSPQLLQIFGLPPDSPNPDQEAVLAMCHPEDRVRLTAETALVRAGFPMDTRFRILRPDGEVRWVQCSSRAITDSKGTPAVVFGVGFDITDRIRAEEQLRLSEERLRLAQDVAGIGTFDFDLSTGKKVWSKRTLEILGPLETGEPTSDHSFLRIVHPEFREAVRRQMRMMPKVRSFAIECKIIRSDGEIRWISVIGRVLKNDSGRRVRYLGCIFDITERKDAEAQLIGNKEQLRALTGRLQGALEAERKRLSAELHDRLGQSLTGIKMNLEWILRKQKSESHVWASTVVESVGMVDQAIAMVQNLSMELRPQLLEAQGLRAAIEWDAEQIHHRAGIGYSIDIPEGDLGLTSEQEIGLFRIFQEGMRNVVRHSRARTIRLQFQRTVAAGHFVLEDDGVGASAETLKQASCLGIMGMREQAIRIGARFEFASHAGQGTTITLHIPAAKPADEVRTD